MNEVIKINNLKKIYYTLKEEITAVEDFTYTINEGDFIAIVGPSGCGKSTILSILSGLDNKTSGSIEIKDNKKIGYMLQQDALFDWRTVLNNCLIGLEIKNIKTTENINYVKDLLETYGLKEFINSYPTSLSGGMRQRVALIRTLATKPEILLLDEPYSALDYQTRLVVSNDVYNILKKENKTTIMVTHDIGEAIALADKIIVLSKRPAVIKKIFNIKYEKDLSPILRRQEPEFTTYYNLIWKEIDQNV